MKVITTKVFNFSELSTEAQDVAIEQVRTQEHFGDDFAEWAIDDCSLLEPNHDELVELFGEDYKFPLIENTRGRIFFDTGRNWFIDVENAINVTNDSQFLTWLGLSKELQEKVSYNIFTPKYRNSDTTIEFEEVDEEEIIEAEEQILIQAVEKFNNHIGDILNRIQNDIDYRYSDEAVKDEITDDMFFLENGELTNF